MEEFVISAEETEQSAAVRRLAVASYNIHGCVGTDGRYDPDRIADVLKELKADVIGLQEVDSRGHPGTGDTRQLDFLAHSVGMEAIAGATVLEDSGHYGNAVLTRFPLLAVRRYDLTVPGRESRGALDVELQAGNIPFRIIVTHLGLSRQERRYQGKKIVEILERSPISTLALLGDFNEWHGFGRGVVNFISDLLGKSSGLRTFPSRFPIFSLDRIWIHPSPGLVRMEVYKSPKAKVASDHLPLRAVIKIEEEPPVEEDVLTT
jgi:endonuclease/exonuclease/phosphatase family metal-dependent hydrolase